MMQARFRSDVFWSVAGTLLPVALGAASVPILLRTLSAGAFTAYALGLTVISFAPSLDLEWHALCSGEWLAQGEKMGPEQPASFLWLSPTPPRLDCSPR